MPYLEIAKEMSDECGSDKRVPPGSPDASNKALQGSDELQGEARGRKALEKMAEEERTAAALFIILISKEEEEIRGAHGGLRQEPPQQINHMKGRGVGVCVCISSSSGVR
jgi:hypothetical protein